MAKHVDTVTYALQALERDAKAFETARRKRDRRIYGASVEGATIHQIVTSSGLSEVEVVAIIEAENERRE